MTLFDLGLKQVLDKEINDILFIIQELDREYSVKMNCKDYVKFLQLRDKIKTLSEHVNTLTRLNE